MNFELRRIDPPLQLRQVALDPAWNTFKTVMVLVGGISVFIIFGTLMFWLGGGSQPVASVPRVIERIIERPASAPTMTPAVQPAPSTRGLTPEERAEQYKEERRCQYGIQ